MASNIYFIYYNGKESKQGITVSTNDLSPLEGSRGEAHYIMRWSKGNPQSYIKILGNNISFFNDILFIR